MNLTELNSEFEILFEDLATNGSKGLDMYEKSVCLTYAQETLVRELATANVLENIGRTIFFDSQGVSAIGAYPTSVRYDSLNTLGLEPVLVLDRYLATNGANQTLPVMEVPVAVITSMLKSPYKYPRKNLAYVVVGDESDEVFPPLNFATVSYVRRYVKKPTPIILEALTGSDSIDGLTAATEPIIDVPLHRTLLEYAVQFAIKTYIGIPDQSADNK